MYIVQFRKNSRKLFYARDHDGGALSPYDFLKKDFKIELPTRRNSPRGISLQKKKEICDKLLPLIPVASHPFWNELSESETSCDLLTKNDED
jgi:hypothetical protein